MSMRRYCAAVCAISSTVPGAPAAPSREGSPVGMLEGFERGGYGPWRHLPGAISREPTPWNTPAAAAGGRTPLSGLKHAGEGHARSRDVMQPPP